MGCQMKRGYLGAVGAGGGVLQHHLHIPQQTHAAHHPPLAWAAAHAHPLPRHGPGPRIITPVRIHPHASICRVHYLLYNIYLIYASRQ